MKNNKVYFCGLSKNKQIVKSFQLVQSQLEINKINPLGDSVSLITNENNIQDVFKWQTDCVQNSKQQKLIGVMQPLVNNKKTQMKVMEVYQLPDQLIFHTETNEIIIMSSSLKSSLIFRSRITIISSGLEHCLALASDTRVYAWGSNTNGALGVGNDISQQDTPLLIKSLVAKNIIGITCGSFHNVCHSPTDVYVWGKGDDGALGLNNSKTYSEPIINAKIKASEIKKIGCGESHTTILTNSGNVISFGSNLYGQLGIDKNIKLSSDPFQISKIHNQIDDIFVGLNHCFAVTNKNYVYGWGNNKYGQLGTGQPQDIYIQPTQIPIPFTLNYGSHLKFTLTQNQSYALYTEASSQRQTKLSYIERNSEKSRQTFIDLQQKFSGYPLQKQDNYTSINLQKFDSMGRPTPNHSLSEEMFTEAKQSFIFNHDKNDLLEIWQNISSNWNSQKKDIQTLHLVERGIPINFRKQIWGLALPNRSSITKDLYESKIEEGIFYISVGDKLNLQQSRLKSLNMIDLDIARTFPDISLFRQGSPIKQSLRRILIAFTTFRSDIGYVQGMSYIGGLLLMYFEEYECFVRFSALITAPSLLPIFSLHASQPLLLQRIKTFEKLLFVNLPQVAQHFDRLGVDPSSYLVEWIMALYTKTLNPDTTSRIWDLFFLRGIEILWRTAIAILILLQVQVLVDDIGSVYKCLKGVNELVTDEDLLVQTLLRVKYPKDLASDFNQNYTL